DPGPAPAAAAAFAVAVALVGAGLAGTDGLDRGAVPVGGPVSVDPGRFVRLAAAGGTAAVLVVGLIGAPAVYDAGTGATRHHLGDRTAAIDTAMRDLGVQTRRAVPPGETVYVQPNARANWFYSSYAFYANRPMREVSVDRLRHDPSIAYVLVTTEGLTFVDERDHEIIAMDATLRLAVAEVGPPEEE
ncbi:MAG: hypothetical protein ABEH40_09800, partial [Haloferacaceae archaeon]